MCKCGAELVVFGLLRRRNGKEEIKTFKSVRRYNTYCSVSCCDVATRKEKYEEKKNDTPVAFAGADN